LPARACKTPRKLRVVPSKEEQKQEKSTACNDGSPFDSKATTERINPFQMPEPGEPLITPLAPMRSSHGPALARSEAFNEIHSLLNFESFFHSAPAKLDGTEALLIPGNTASPYIKDLILIARLDRQATPSADMSQASGLHFLK